MIPVRLAIVLNLIALWINLSLFVFTGMRSALAIAGLNLALVIINIWLLKRSNRGNN